MKTLRSRLARTTGMTLVEVVFAMFVLLLCAFVFVATFPMSTQSRSKADHRSKAISMAARQLEAAREAGYSSLITFSGLSSRGMIDSSASASPYSISNVTLDSNQSISSVLPGGSGTMAVTTQVNQPLTVSVTVRWTERGALRSVTLSTLIADI